MAELALSGFSGGSTVAETTDDEIEELSRRLDRDSDSGSTTDDDRRRSFRKTATSISEDSPDDAGGSGGGIVDGVLEATGITAYRQSESGQALQDQMNENAQDRQEADSHTGRLMADLGKFDTATRAGLDVVLDNPSGSVQEGLQEAMKKPTEVARGEEVSDEELGEAFQSTAQRVREATSGTVAEGSAVDNEATETVVDAGTWLGEALVAEPAKAALRGSTGVDLDEGDTEGTVGAIDAFDIGVTVGTAGLGKAGLTAGKAALRGSDDAARVADDVVNFGARSSDESGAAGRLLDRLGIRGGDETAAGATDEQVRAAVEATEEAAGSGSRLTTDLFGVSRRADEIGPVTRAGNRLDEALGRLTARGSDDVARTGDETVGATDEQVRAAVEATEEAGTAGGRSGRLLDRLGIRSSDEAARGADEAAQGSDDAGRGLVARLTPNSRTGQAALLGGAIGAGAIGGGTLATMIDEATQGDQVQMADGSMLTKERNLQPTKDDRAPEGATLWRVDDANGRVQGYTIVVGAAGRNVKILSSDGSVTTSRVSSDEWESAMQRGQERAEQARNQRGGR